MTNEFTANEFTALAERLASRVVVRDDDPPVAPDLAAERLARRAKAMAAIGWERRALQLVADAHGGGAVDNQGKVDGRDRDRRGSRCRRVGPAAGSACSSSRRRLISARRRSAALCLGWPVWRAMMSSFFRLCSQPTSSVTVTW